MAVEDDLPPLASADLALLRTAATGEGAIPLTKELVERLSESITKRNADIAARFPKLVTDCPYETRLAVAAWVFEAIVDHARDGGTFRHLIYGRLGFDSDAYYPLYVAGGMTISNEFDLSEKPQDGSSIPDSSPPKESGDG